MNTEFFWAYLAEDTGRYDGVTANGLVLVQGVNPEQAWWLSLDGGTTWTQSYGTSFTLAAGQHHVLLKRSEYELPYLLGKIRVDQTAPEAPQAQFSNNGEYITGSAEAGATVKVHIMRDGMLVELASTVAGSDGRYSIRIPSLGNAETVQVTAIDSALNQSEVSYVKAPLILENLLATADNQAFLHTQFLATEIANPLQHKTSFSLLSADLGPVLAADVVTRVFGAALHFDVAENTQRQLSLKGQSGGVQVGAMYDLHIYKLNQATGEWVSQYVERNWLKAVLLAGVSGEFEIRLDAGQYMMVLGNGLGVSALTGYTLKMVSDLTLDYSQPTGATGEITGNVLQDIDFNHGLDVLPEGTRILSMQVLNEAGNLDHYLVGDQGTYSVQGLYGVLYIQSNGSYRYEIDADFQLIHSVTEVFSYEVATLNGARSTANLSIQINASRVPETQVDYQLILQPEPSIYAGESLGKVVDFSILEVELLKPILGADALAFKGAMSFNVEEQTLRELTFKGASGGIEIGSQYDLVIYKLDPATGHFIQHHVVEDWFKVILFGGVSKPTSLSFTPGQYKVVLAGKTLIGALKGTAVEVLEDVIKDYSQPLSHTVSNPLSGDFTVDAADQVLKVNQSFISAEGVTQVQGQFGLLSIERSGEYHYQPYSSSTAAYGEIESFSYLVRHADGSQRIEVINIQINNQHASDDVNALQLDTSNKVLSHTEQDKPHRKDYSYSFKVDAATQTDITLSAKVLSLLNNNRELKYTLTNITTGQVQQGSVTGKNPSLEQFKFTDLSAGDYVLSLNLDSSSGLAGTITSVSVTQNSLYVSEFVSTAPQMVTGNILGNDLGLSHFTGISIADQSIYTGAGQQSMQVAGQYGSLTLHINGDYSYQAYGNASGVEQFEYRLNSAVGSQSKAVLEIHVGQHIQASSADETVIASSAHDQLHLGLGQDTLVFNLLDNNSATGGNGSSIWHDFQAGHVNQNRNADKIDLSQLLPQLAPEQLSDYLMLSYDQGSQTLALSIDRDGQGSHFAEENLLYLSNQSQALSLDELLYNQQILF